MTRHPNPDWYGVKYTLAAEYANWAMELGPWEADPALLERAAEQVWDLLQATVATLEPRGRTAKRRLNPGLETMLRDVVLPSALILLAGVLLAEGERPHGLREEPPDRLAQDELIEAVRSRRRVDPFALVQLVETDPHPSKDALYNLACFYAQAGRFDLSIDRLRASVRDASATRQTLIVQQVQRDPLLAPVLREFGGRLFDEQDLGGGVGQSGETRPWI